MGGRGQAHLSLDHGQVKSQKGNGWFLGHCFLNACLVPGIVLSARQMLPDMRLEGTIRGGRQTTDKLRRKLTGQGTSLVVQWLRIHLPMQGTWVSSMV